MTTAQELFDVLKNARPGPNYKPKETASHRGSSSMPPIDGPGGRAVAAQGACRPPAGHQQATKKPIDGLLRGRLFVPLTPGRVELPALGGCVELVYEDER